MLGEGRLKFGIKPDGKGVVSMNLSEVRVGNTVRVLKLNGTGPVRRRIMDMGITKGQEIYVRKVAPLGDPMEVTVRKYELSVRKADCKMIEVEPVDPADEAEPAAEAAESAAAPAAEPVAAGEGE